MSFKRGHWETTYFWRDSVILHTFDAADPTYALPTEDVAVHVHVCAIDAGAAARVAIGPSAAEAREACAALPALASPAPPAPETPPREPCWPSSCT